MFNKKIVYFFLFYIVTLLLYFESRFSGFVTDFIGFETNYDRCGFWNYYQCVHGKNFRYLQHAFSYFLYKQVGSDTLIWYILYSLFHALTAYLVFIVVLKLLENISFNQAKFISLLSACLFLVSPFQSEVVVWRVCIQYNFICICLLLSIYYYIKDYENNNSKYPIYCFCLMVIGLLSLEQTVIMPYFLILIAIFFAIYSKSTQHLKRQFFAYFLPQHLLIGIYFLASKLIYGNWIMHYGAQSYEGIFSLKTISKFFEYFLKYVFLVRCWNHEYKAVFFSTVEKPMITIMLTILLISLLIVCIRKFIKGSAKSGLITLVIALYIISLIPVIQLYFTILLNVENDRLGYLSSIFIFLLLVIILADFRPIIRKSLAILFVLFNLFFTIKISHYWHRSTQIYYSYLKDFKANTYENVYLLGVPDNYKGIWMMRMYGRESAFKEALKYRLKKPFAGNIYDVIYFNQTSFDDGMKVSKKNDSTLCVEFSNYGSWFWNQGVGAQDYETSSYKVIVHNYNYDVIFKNYNRNNSIILYPSKLKWKAVDF